MNALSIYICHELHLKEVKLLSLYISAAQYVAKKRISHIKKANAIKHTDRILLKKTLVAWKVNNKNYMLAVTQCIYIRVYN